jgi:uncharacterized protein
MESLNFITATPPVVSDPVRADIACFVGFVARRDDPPVRLPEETDDEYLQRALPSWVCSWLAQQDWNPDWHGRSVDDLVTLQDVPVVIDSWDAFDSLFAWDKRPLDNGGRICHTALGVALRHFFAHGGRRCYVVRVGDPWPFLIPSEFDSAALTLRRTAKEALRPTMPAPTASDRESWRGIGHLFGLPDVSFLSMPDVPEVFAMESWPRKTESETVAEEHFVEAGSWTEPDIKRPLRSLYAPRCDESGFREWARFVGQVGDFLNHNAATRAVQFLAAVPLPADEQSLAGDPALTADSPVKRRQQAALKIRAVRDAQWREVAEIQTAFVQLAYPWVRNRDTMRLPGDLAAPDGLLTGLLAANAMTRGTWNSLTRQSVPFIDAVEPVLDRATLEGAPSPRLRDRITVFGPTAGGMRMLSDVTTDDDESYRPANVSRLVSALVRAARALGEQCVFENNGETLWNRLRGRFSDLMTGLWAEGALAGASPAEAFEVLCDRSTITQADLDAGRVIVRVSFTAAMPIVRIVVAFALNEGGQVSLLGKQGEALS